MRFKGKDINGKGNGVVLVAIGKSEMIILMDLLVEAYINTPKSLFTQPFTSRVDGMKTELAKIMRQEGIQWPIKRQNYKLDEGEVL